MTMTTVGRYELVSRIGAGGMGEVFLARAVGAGGFEKEVVIKRVLPHLASDPGFVQRFIEEGKLVVRLRHAGIAQVLDMGEEDGVYFIAMEHVDGKDLGELVRIAQAAGERMPIPLVVHLLVELLDALDYAHHAKDADGRALGVIHRDVSPSNVMIATTGEVKLLDFGIARATERLQSSTTGAIRGKYGYMSPQQAAGLELDARSDLFSLGVIAWELLTGERPFDGASDLLTLDRIRYHDPGPLRAKAPDVPEDLAAVVERLLAKNPDDRFASADEAARALRAHIMKSGRLASARELAAWMESLVATLPQGLRDRSVQGMSIDELLRLGLGSEPGKRPSSPDLARRAAPSTAMAAPAGADGGVMISTPHAIEPAVPVVAKDPPVAATSPRRARAPWFFVGLVALNLALITLVILLMLRDDNDKPGPTTRLAGADDVVGSDVIAHDAGVGDSAGDAVAADSVAVDSVAVDTPTGEAAAIEVTVPPPIVPGTSFGGALAGLDEGVLEGEIAFVIRAHPPGAAIAVNGLGTARAPRTIEARRGTPLTGRVSAPDFEPRTFEATVGDEPLTITLKPVPRGRVQFKFFPADGTRVSIDGKPFAVGGNVVATELPVGAHTLVLETRDGKKLVRSFDITSEQTTNLGTLDAARGG